MTMREVRFEKAENSADRRCQVQGGRRNFRCGYTLQVEPRVLGRMRNFQWHCSVEVNQADIFWGCFFSLSVCFCMPFSCLVGFVVFFFVGVVILLDNSRELEKFSILYSLLFILYMNEKKITKIQCFHLVAFFFEGTADLSMGQWHCPHSSQHSCGS